MYITEDDLTLAFQPLQRLGVPVVNVLPDRFVTYELEEGVAVILWRTSGALLNGQVDIEANETDSGFLGFGAQDGEDKTVLFDFVGDTVIFLELVDSQTGVEF